MSPKERRAYRLGFLRAMRKARRELDEMGRRLDDELAGLEDRMRAAREQTAQWLDDELNGVRAECRPRVPSSIAIGPSSMRLMSSAIQTRC